MYNVHSLEWTSAVSRVQKQCKAKATQASLRLCEASLKLALKDVSDSGVRQFCANSEGFFANSKVKILEQTSSSG